MTMIYNVRGEHPEVGGQQSRIAFTQEEADAHAMNMLAILASDMGFDWGGRQPPANTWPTTLYVLQAIRVAENSGGSFTEVYAEFEGASDSLAVEADFSVWIETHDVSIPGNIPGRLPETVRVWTVAQDTDNGTETYCFITNEEAQDHVFAQVETSREEFEVWQTTREKGQDDDIYTFIEPHKGHLDTYSIDCADLPLADLVGVLPIPDIAVILEGGVAQNVLSRDGQPVRVTVVDYDTEGSDDKDLTAIPQSGPHTKPGDTENAHLSFGGFVHDNDTEPFWQAIVGDPHAKPEYRTVWVSVIDQNDGSPRVSCFRTQEDRRQDLIEFFREMEGEDAGDGGVMEIEDDYLEDMVTSAINDRFGWTTTLSRTAMKEG